MGHNHHLAFYDYLYFITNAPLNDVQWTREIRKYLKNRRDQMVVYKEWLSSGECLSEWYKMHYE